MFKTTEEIAAEMAELNLSFPIVAPRLIENLQQDRDVFYGFDTPVLSCLAKHQVPYIMSRLEDIGAYVSDAKRKSRYSPVHRSYITDGKGRSAAAKAAYYRGFSDVVYSKIATGVQNKMAALTLTLTEDAYKKLNETVWPILRNAIAEEEASVSQSNKKTVNILFCSVMENNAQ